MFTREYNKLCRARAATNICQARPGRRVNNS